MGATRLAASGQGRRNPATWSGRRFSRQLVQRDRIDPLPWPKSSLGPLNYPQFRRNGDRAPIVASRAPLSVTSAKCSQEQLVRGV